jgi:hypothetical protein
MQTDKESTSNATPLPRAWYDASFGDFVPSDVDVVIGRLTPNRVLLTRARQGMVLLVSPGDSADPTRAPAFYDPTFNYRTGLGIPALK